jgi:hypothetical protein
MARRIGTRRNDVRNLGTDALAAINQACRSAAVEIMNDLGRLGPAYTGEFRDSWIAIPVGGGASGSAGGEYPYQIQDVPELSLNRREVARAVKFTIENTQPYAEYALDLKEGKFYPPDEFGPIKEPVKEGSRASGLTKRGDISSDGVGEAKSTAELDWYATYASGGGMQKALERGVKLGFKA